MNDQSTLFDKSSGELEIGNAVLFQELHDEVVLLNMDTQQYYGLDSVGAEAWRQLLQHRTLAGAWEAMVQRFDADPEKIRQDLSTLIRELLDAGLLQPTVPRPAQPL